MRTILADSWLVTMNERREVRDVFVDGRVVMRGGRIASVDEAAALRRSRVAADDVARRSISDRFKARPCRTTGV